VGWHLGRSARGSVARGADRSRPRRHTMHRRACSLAASYARQGWWQLVTRVLLRLRQCALLCREWRVFAVSSLQLLAPVCHNNALLPVDMLAEMQAVLGPVAAAGEVGSAALTLGLDSASAARRSA